MSVTFSRRTLLPAPPEACYHTSLSVDFHQASFAESGERAIGGVRSGEMQLGEIVTWRARHLGRWWTMTSIITEADPPHRFVDEQHKGPFKQFWHEHEFRPTGDGSTEMTDRISFTAPLGPFGRVAELLVLRWYMPRLIDVRNEALADHMNQRTS